MNSEIQLSTNFERSSGLLERQINQKNMLQVQGVFKEYRRERMVVQALAGLSLQVRDGEFLALMGPSGSGKSTLLHLIAGLESPSSGDILLNGKSTQGLSDKEWTEIRRNMLGMVFQAFHLVPGLTVIENVELPLRLKGMPRKTVKEWATQTLNRVGMESRALHRPSELSGGEQQRVAIARAIVPRPKIILADEPTGNLDSNHAKEIIHLLRDLSKIEQQTVLLVTHSELAASVADRQYEMCDGQLFERGS